MEQWYKCFLRALVLALIGGFAAFTLESQAQEPRVALPGHVLPALSTSSAISRALDVVPDSAAPMMLTIVLRRRDEEGFQRFLDELYDPGSPSFGHWLSANVQADIYGPGEDDYQAVEGYFRSQGFAIGEQSSNRVTLTVSAPRSTVERALGVTIGDFTVKQADGSERRFRSNEADPTLPASVARHVEAIVGLSDLAQQQPLTSKWNTIACQTSAYFNGISGFATINDADGMRKEAYKRCKDEVTKCTAGKHFEGNDLQLVSDVCNQWAPPKDVMAADAPVAWKDANGAGQKVALTAFDTFASSDVADYLALFGMPATLIGNVSTVHVNGGASAGAAQSEVLLDIQSVLIGAPHAQIAVYEAPFGPGSFQAVFNRMIADGATVISNSWAYCEDQTSAADVQSIDSILASAAAAGISVVTAAGDSGSTCLDGSANTINVPSGVPHATAVGGTSATTGPDGLWQAETWWDNSASTPPGGQGGFGVSRFFARPSYQLGFTASAYRSVPDVAFPADPRNGVAICYAAGGGCPAPVSYGGTSFSAPAWAAGIARINHALGRRVGFLNPQLYPLANSGRFHPPAELSSDFAHVGLGSPMFNRLYLALANAAAGPVSPSQSEARALDAQVGADGTSKTFVVVRLRDAHGNTVAGKTVTLQQSAGGHATITPASAPASNANGAVLFEVKDSTVENLGFTAVDTTDGITLADAPSVQFVVPIATAAAIFATPTTVLNDGVATTTITVTLQDARALPTRGKTVSLSQGTGHSIISGPTPSVTDINGQIQFTATNHFAETVVYTAVDITDGDLPVPGNATVTFSGTANTSCASPTPPTAAAGFAIAPWATGFFAENFFYGNVNWGGCPGASNPGFTPTGSAYVANFRTGDLFLLPGAGGAASSGNTLSNLGQTLGQPTFGKDGRLYMTHGATTGNFFTGDIIEVDAATGAKIRVVAANLTCPNGLAVDPLSGDLFVNDSCSGAGSDDAHIYRIANPAGANPIKSTYATMPGTPTGWMSFAPDGTLYVVAQYFGANPPVYQVSGTDKPFPPSVTLVPGINSTFWVTIGETLPSGAAKSLIVSRPSSVDLVDITTNPPTATTLVNAAMSSGRAGPDGCLYMSASDTIYRLTAANGTCGFVPTNPAPGISLSPAAIVPDPVQGGTITLTAQMVGVPQAAGVPIHLAVLGANPQGAVADTDASGKATFSYRGIAAGRDTMLAYTELDGSTVASNLAHANWSAGKHTAFVNASGSPTSSVVATPVTLVGSLIDASASPQAPISGKQLHFDVGGQSCNGTTSASGVASCGVTLPLTGHYTLMVIFAGDSQFTASTDARGFDVLAAPPPPCSTFNDVDSASPFCANVDYIKARAVTLGCAPGLYCPFDVVTRGQMAAFMNRLGRALTGNVLFAEQQPGALDPGASPVVCQTADFATGTFARRALVDGVLAGQSASDLPFGVAAVASLDAGATWAPLAGVTERGFVKGGQWGSLRASGFADVPAGQSVRFALELSRDGQGGSATFAASRCRLRVKVDSP